MMDLDVSEGYAPRIVKRAPANTNPLEITAAERRALNEITTIFVGNTDEINHRIENEPDKKKQAKIREDHKVGLINIPSSSAIHQVRATYAAIVGIEALMSDNINALVQTALMGLRELDEIQGVSPFIFGKKDGANRDLVPDERIALKDMALRLGQAARPKNDADVDRALCLRALVCAAITAERGLVHLAKENFGVIIRTLSHEYCELRNQVTWTDELQGFARRHARALVRVP
jgi:hypothetical protein